MAQYQRVFSAGTPIGVHRYAAPSVEVHPGNLQFVVPHAHCRQKLPTVNIDIRFRLQSRTILSMRESREKTLG